MTAFDGMHVLVTDDESDIRFLLRQVIEPLGVTVFEAEDGKDALSVLQNEEIDLMITDLNMPNMDGLSLLKVCHQQYPQLNIIVLTAFGDRESILLALNCHVFDFLEKPFVNDVILARVRNALALTLQRRFLWAITREFIVEHCHLSTREQFNGMSFEEKERVMKAALGIISLRDLKK